MVGSLAFCARWVSRETAGGEAFVAWFPAGAEIRRIQDTYGKDSFALLSGVSLTNEKSYLIGKFARLALQTANLDYNGRLCMVSAGAANKKALGIDRASNPWSDIPLADVVFIAGANVAECAEHGHASSVHRRVREAMWAVEVYDLAAGEVEREDPRGLFVDELPCVREDGRELSFEQIHAFVPRFSAL